MPKNTPQTKAERIVNWLMETTKSSLSPKDQALEIRRKLLAMNIALHNGDPEANGLEIDLNEMVEQALYERTRTPERDEIVDDLLGSSNPFSDENMYLTEERHADKDSAGQVFVIQPNSRRTLTAEALRECLLRIASGKSNNPDGPHQDHDETEDLSKREVA